MKNKELEYMSIDMNKYVMEQLKREVIPVLFKEMDKLEGTYRLYRAELIRQIEEKEKELNELKEALIKYDF